MNMSFSETPPKSGAEDLALQVAALCWRMHRGHVEVLLITSRETGRWVLPKGWPMAGLSPAESAKTEAWEEAGVQGDVAAAPLGQYCYDKTKLNAAPLPCGVDVFALKVHALKTRFPEAKQRRRVWFAASEAAQMVAEPTLRALLTRVDQDPSLLEAAKPLAGA